MIFGFHENPALQRVGCKGHNLSRMWRAGLPVPPGVCITLDDIGDIQADELEGALQRLGATAYAVRSSAIEEDTSIASYAGMLLSRLNVKGHASVFAALHDIRDSASAAAAVAYSQRLKVQPCLRIAAVVQAFVPAEASGVLFMRNPAGAERDFVVEASWGLGPAVVEGLVRPDRWAISPDGSVISADVADKDIAVVPDEFHGTTQISVDPSCRRRPCVTEESLKELSRLAVECEGLFGGPQDIEWALHDGRVWLLQSRPITGNSGTSGSLSA